jgi:hypothetical protein
MTAASAFTDVSLSVPQATAFAALGHSCGGIQEQVFATGFDLTTGYPAGDVYLSTHCSGSGHSSPTHTYSAWLAVTWDFSGTLSTSSILAAAPTVDPTLVVSNGAGAVLTNSQNHAILSVSLPGLPTHVTATQMGGQILVSWLPGPEAAPEITSTTITATPADTALPPVQAVVTGPAMSALIVLAPATSYYIVVVNNDLAGSSPPSSAARFVSGGSATPPPAPTNVMAWWTGQLAPAPSLGVHWNASQAGPVTIDSYEVLVVWQDGDNPGGTYDQIVGGQTLSTYFAVDNTSDWRIKVRAHDVAGWGPWSPPMTIGGV